jgi:hypothetical protein
MLPMRLFHSRAFSAGNAAVFCLNGSIGGAIFFAAQFEQVTLGQGALGAGLGLPRRRHAAVTPSTAVRSTSVRCAQ